ncbi:MAG: hypothetical protein AB7O67_08190 [Vicinamibacterales bacterium]
MASPAMIGVGAGLLSTVVATVSNLHRGDPHLVSTAPDLLTLVAIVAIVWRAVRWTGGLDDARGRHPAQVTAVVASTVFAVGMGAFTLWYLPSHAPVLAAAAAVSSFLLACVTGVAASRPIRRIAV